MLISLKDYSHLQEDRHKNLLSILNLQSLHITTKQTLKSLSKSLKLITEGPPFIVGIISWKSDPKTHLKFKSKPCIESPSLLVTSDFARDQVSGVGKSRSTVLLCRNCWYSSAIQYFSKIAGTFASDLWLR